MTIQNLKNSWSARASVQPSIEPSRSQRRRGERVVVKLVAKAMIGTVFADSKSWPSLVAVVSRDGKAKIVRRDELAPWLLKEGRCDLATDCSQTPVKPGEMLTMIEGSEPGVSPVFTLLTMGGT